MIIDVGIPRPTRPPLTPPRPPAELDPFDALERVPGVYTTNRPMVCALCRSRIVSGRLRPWIDAGQPLCHDCTNSRGLGDVEAIIEALTAARRFAPTRDPAVEATLRGAAYAWAMHRLIQWTAETLEEPR